MAHELGHVRNYDIRVSLIVFGLVVAVGIIADMLLRLAFFGGGRRGGNGQAQLLVPDLRRSSPRSSRRCSRAPCRRRSRASASTSPTRRAR